MIKSKWITSIRPKNFVSKSYKAYGIPGEDVLMSLFNEMDNNKEALASLLGVTSYHINKWLKHYKGC